eukprot:jgi/Chlat1/617/Chrsp103S00960
MDALKASDRTLPRTLPVAIISAGVLVHMISAITAMRLHAAMRPIAAAGFAGSSSGAGGVNVLHCIGSRAVALPAIGNFPAPRRQASLVMSLPTCGVAHGRLSITCTSGINDSIKDNKTNKLGYASGEARWTADSVNSG